MLLENFITMNFDRMGRRVFYKEEVAGVVTKHHKFVYDNYLCVQKVDALNNNSQINLFVWDPTEPVATRPLFTTGSGNRKFFYTCDGNKNVSELVHFETRNGIAAHYDYAPFGAVTRAISASTITDNTFTTYCCLYHDICLAKVDENYLVNSEAKRRAQKDCDSRLTVCWAGATLCPGKTPFIERVKVLFLGIPAMATVAHPIPPEIRSHEDGRNVEVRFTLLLFQF